jgi:uncharacterized protein (DUF427 family)
MQAVWHGQVIAASERTREVAGYRYFPREDVRMELLQPTEKTPSDLACPHGVQFFDVVDGASRSPRAAWSYEAPRPPLTPVERWIGFWEDVQIG